MRRRLDLAVSLLAGPPVLFLDEPTTGLDPRSRNELWDVLRGLVADGTTLLLTTQYLEEADQLADTIVVMDRGRIIAQGTPLQLKQAGGRRQPGGHGVARRRRALAAALLRKTGAEVFVDSGARRLIAAADGLTDMTRVASWLRDGEIEVDDIGLSRPSLDDVFLSMTGRRADPAPMAERRRHDHRRAAAVHAIAPAGDPPHKYRAAVVDHGEAQYDPHEAHARDAERRDNAADHVRAVVRVRVRCVDHNTGGPSYREFLLPGIQAQTIVFAAFVVAAGITNDIEKGIIDRFRSLPIARSSVLIGRSVASLIHSSIGIVVMAVTGLAIGWRIRGSVTQAALAFALVLVFGFGIIWFGILVGSLMRSVEAVNGVMFTALFPITFPGQHVCADGADVALAAGDRRMEPGVVVGPGDARTVGPSCCMSRPITCQYSTGTLSPRQESPAPHPRSRILSIALLRKLRYKATLVLRWAQFDRN